LTTALIDGDELIFKACAGSKDEVDWDLGEIARVSVSFAEATAACERKLEEWVNAAGADDYVIVLSPRNRQLFRRGIFAPYKSGRGDKPNHFWELDGYLRSSHDAKDYPGLEADDTMGLMSGPGRIIVSSDKDMKTVPGPLYNPGKKTKGVITSTRADWQWMYQTLMGDATDGFGGCAGCGATGAAALLDQANDISGWWPLVVERFCKPKTKRYAATPQDERDARLHAKLARILRPGDYDPKDGSVAYAIHRHLITFNAHDLAT
jgi:hypothetical protein